MFTWWAVADGASADFYWNRESSSRAMRLLLVACSGERRLQEALRG